MYVKFNNLDHLLTVLNRAYPTVQILRGEVPRLVRSGKNELVLDCVTQEKHLEPVAALRFTEILSKIPADAGIYANQIAQIFVVWNEAHPDWTALFGLNGWALATHYLFVLCKALGVKSVTKYSGNSEPDNEDAIGVSIKLFRSYREEEKPIVIISNINTQLSPLEFLVKFLPENCLIVRAAEDMSTAALESGASKEEITYGGKCFDEIKQTLLNEIFLKESD